jgi:hypothetical protein
VWRVEAEKVYLVWLMCSSMNVHPQHDVCVGEGEGVCAASLVSRVSVAVVCTPANWGTAYLTLVLSTVGTVPLPWRGVEPACQNMRSGSWLEAPRV